MSATSTLEPATSQHEPSDELQCVDFVLVVGSIVRETLVRTIREANTVPRGPHWAHRIL